MGGFLVPPWYTDEDPSWLSLTLVTFMFGFSSACAVFTAVSIIHQTRRAWHRSRKITAHPYIVMITVEWTSSVIISVVSFLFVIDMIPPSFWLFFGILCLWVLQIQCIMHIIINRISLIMYDARRVRRLKVAATLLIGVINITVFIIWIPARLQINERWIMLNSIWDRIEKGIFAIFDLGLNLYFIYLVRAELTIHGLTKYRYLYMFNIGMIFISISLDIILIGIMSIPHESTFIYVQFHPLMYLIKLKIEMNMADLIVKIVKATSHPPGHELHRYAASNTQIPRPLQSRNNSDNSTKKSLAAAPSSSSGGTVLSQTTLLGTMPSGATTTTLAAQAQAQQAQQAVRPLELSRMPSSFDVEDVVDTRKASVVEVGGQGSAGALTLAGFAPMRPAFVRNMSEMTVLEIDAGYLNPSSKEKRMSGDHPPC